MVMCYMLLQNVSFFCILISFSGVNSGRYFSFCYIVVGYLQMSYIGTVWILLAVWPVRCFVYHNFAGGFQCQV